MLKEILRQLKAEIFAMRDTNTLPEHDQYRIGFNKALDIVSQKLDSNDKQSMPPCRWCGKPLSRNWVCSNTECSNYGE